MNALLLALSLAVIVPAHAADPCRGVGLAIAQDLKGTMEGEDRIASERIGALDVIYEDLAHRIAYKEELTPTDEKLLERWGYESDPIHVHGRRGFSMMLFKPLPGSDRTPVVAFRGTEPTDLGDLVSDMDMSIGRDQYQENHDLIETIVKEAGGKVDMVGHSLGAALAQHAAVEHHDLVRNVVGFQSPGVSYAEARAFRNLDPETRPRVRFHLSANDAVDNGGASRLPGETFVHTPRPSRELLAAHTDFLLLSARYRPLRNQAGLTGEVDVTVHDLGKIMGLDPKAPVTYQTTYHEPYMSTAVEAARQVVAVNVEVGQAVKKRFWKALIGR